MSTMPLIYNVTHMKVIDLCGIGVCVDSKVGGFRYMEIKITITRL